MSHPPIVALGFAEASALVNNPGGAAISALLCIHGPREFAVESPAVPLRKVLRFDDTEAPDPEDPLSAAMFRFRQRRAAADGLTLVPPTPGHADEIIAFAEAVRGARGLVVCHCFAGVSRSTAAALICLAVWTGPGREQECMAHLLRIRPCAAPHDGLVLFADRRLGRGGRLAAASAGL